MKLTRIQRLTQVIGILASTMALSARAEFIQPVDVWVSNGTDTKDKIIDGAGFDDTVGGTPTSVHSATSGEMWSAVGSTKADVVFDLGKTVDLTKVYIWNYNVSGSTDVGIKDVEILVSPDTNMTNGNFTAIAAVALKEGGATGQVFSVTGTDVRMVKLRGLSNWGNGYTVGLAEARFESGTVGGKVPSVVISSPHEGDVIDAKTNTVVTVKATVADKDNNLAKIELFDGTTKLGETNKSPYTFDYKAPSVGDHELRVTATDKTGFVSWATVKVTVRELVADRIIQIDDTVDEGPGLNQISYTGTWNLAQGVDSDPRFQHNDHYESNNTKTDYFEVRFAGVKIDIYATVASHHGTGKATIDGGTAYTVNYKAAQRGEQVLVWSSPILPQREHVLRVTVAGDGVVTADRFDVSVSDKPVDRAVIKTLTASATSLVVEVEDVGQSVINKDTVKLFLENALLASTAAKAGSLTTITSPLAAPLPPGSTNHVRVTAQEMSGTSITNESVLVMPAPWFPLTGMGEPSSVAGKWGFRQIWGAGRADAVVTAVGIAQAVNQPEFTGRVQDTNVAFINFGYGGTAGGFMLDDLPFPAEAAGLASEDFVVVARARVVVPTRGDWTIGIHSDEGFALRFIGAPFGSVAGNGARDDDFPEYMAMPVPTADSSTFGVINNLAAGQYDLELVYFQRTGAAFCEIYTAPGALTGDADSADWQLIGAAGGWQIVAAPPTGPVTLRQLAKTGDRVTITFDTPAPDSPHQLRESVDLKSWQTAVGATFEKTGGNTLRATVSGVAGSTSFYRVSLTP